MRPPSLRTGRAGLPHPALQLVVHHIGAGSRNKEALLVNTSCPTKQHQLLSPRHQGCPQVLRSGPGVLRSAARPLSGFCGLLSPEGHSRHAVLGPVRRPSTFLRPFAPPALPGFTATMDALTPRPLTHGRGLPDSCTLPSHHSVSNHLVRPRVAFARYPSAHEASSLPRCFASAGTVDTQRPWVLPSLHSGSGRSGLRPSLAGSPPHPAESSSLSYGLAVHLPLLPTPPHGDAVTVRYRPESVCLKGTSTPPTEYTFRRTRWLVSNGARSATC